MAITNGKPLWVESRTDHHAVEYRRMLLALIGKQGGPAAIGDFDVTQNGTPNFSVNVAAGDLFVPSTTVLGGCYYVKNDAVVNLAIGSAPGAGLTRWDLVAVKVQDPDISGATVAASLVVIPGTASATPADPAIPADGAYYVLKRVVVANGQASVTNANIVEKKIALATNPKHLTGTRAQRAAYGTAAGAIQGDQWTDTDDPSGVQTEWMWTGSAWATGDAIQGFGGSVLIGTYDATKPIRHLLARKTGTSDATGLATATLLPAGTTAVLGVTIGLNVGAALGHTIIFRTDLSNLTTENFQLRNAASPYAALGSGIAYDFNHDIAYQ